MFAETSDDHHAAHNEPPEPKTLMGTPSGREAHDVWSRAMILLISGAVLASAATGFLQSRAQSRSDHFALKAHDSQFEFVNRRTRLTAVALGGGLDVPAQMVSIRLRCATATQIAQLAKDQKINGDVAKLDAERARLCDRYDEFRKKDAIAIDVSDAHDLLDSLDDPSQALIDNVLDGKGRSPDAVLARADGLLEIADGWDAKASLFLAVLTTLAIAIYLFGQAHAMGSSRPGQWLVGGGLALFLVSAGLAAWAIALPILPSPKLTGVANCVSESAALSDPVKIIETAAEAYGDGLAQIHLVANSPPGSQDQAKAHDAALDALRCASRLRPSFHLAVSEYDDELRNYRSPQKGDSFISLIGRSEIDEHVKLQRQSLSILNARGLHRSAGQVSDFAYDSMIAAIVSGDREGLGAARRLLSLVNGRASAFERFSVRWLEPDLFVEPESLDDPINLLNLGLAELASGEPGLMEAARADYRRGLGGLPSWQKTPAKKAKFLASALIDLEILRAYCGHLHPAATCQTIAQAMDLIAPNIAAGVWYDEPPSSKASATDFQARVSPYSFGWSAKVDDFNPAKDRLTVAWFRDERAAKGTADDPARWQLLRALPSWLELYGGPAGQDGKGVIPGNSASRAGRSQDSLSDTHTCNGGGNYVAQLFLNGRLIATQTVTLADFDLTSFRTRELDSEWCIPRGWQDWSSTEAGHPWFADRPVRGFKNFVGDHDRFDGALMSFFMPTAMPDSEKSDYALHRALQILLKKGDPREQGASSTATLWSQDIEDRLAANAIRHGSLTDRQCEQADTIDHPMYKVIMDKGGGTLVRIGVVDGHLPFNQACTILASMRPYFTD